jgi:hypothetical protein
MLNYWLGRHQRDATKHRRRLVKDPDKESSRNDYLAYHVPKVADAGDVKE